MIWPMTILEFPTGTVGGVDLVDADAYDLYRQIHKGTSMHPSFPPHRALVRTGRPVPSGPTLTLGRRPTSQRVVLWMMCTLAFVVAASGAWACPAGATSGGGGRGSPSGSERLGLGGVTYDSGAAGELSLPTAGLFGGSVLAVGLLLASRPRLARRRALLRFRAELGDPLLTGPFLDAAAAELGRPGRSGRSPTGDRRDPRCGPSEVDR